MISRGVFTSSLGLGYRYGFNGKENDADVKGDGDQEDYGMRIYDPRLGRFLSIDPITKKYPELTPYQFASNQPIWAVDLDGLEAKVKITTEVTGYTVQRLTGRLPSGNIMIVVPTYKAILTDAQNPNKVVATGSVTRDSWYSRGSSSAGKFDLINRHFEPQDANANLYTGERYNYPVGTDLKAYMLSQNGSSTLNAQPHTKAQETHLDGKPIDEARPNYSQATSIYLHIGGFYQHTPGADKSLAASYGCFGFVSSSQIYSTVQQADDAIKTGTWNKGTSNAQYQSFLDKIAEVKGKYKGTKNDKVLIQVIKRDNVKEQSTKEF
jgi:RHS repeat-associated protein